MKKPKPMPKQAKPAVVGMKKKRETERMELVVDDVCAEEPDKEERISGWKRSAMAKEIHQNQEEEVVAVSTAKRRRKAASSGKKPKPTPKKAKPTMVGMKKKGETERVELVVDDVCAEEPNEEERVSGRKCSTMAEEIHQNQEEEEEEVVAVSFGQKKKLVI
jgi:DNA (cytosine-5)-methyltransferase 1